EDAEKLSPEERMQMIRGMVANLEARLKDNPKDLDGWKRLGRARSVLNDHARGGGAAEEAARQGPRQRAGAVLPRPRRRRSRRQGRSRRPLEEAPGAPARRRPDPRPRPEAPRRAGRGGEEVASVDFRRR